MSSIEIFNDDNYILIDDTSLSHRLVGKKIVKTTTAPALVGMIEAVFSVPANSQTYPIYAMSAPNGVWFSLLATYPEGQGIRWRYMTTAPIGTEHECYVFQDGLSDPLKGTGLVVLWNKDGIVTFDSDANYASFVDMVEVKPGQSFTREYRSGRKYAVCNSVPMVWRTSSGRGGGYTSVSPYGACINNNKITFGQYQYRNTTPGLNSSGNTTAAWFIVLDVTGV